jgi:hypothetical protein
MQTGTENVIRLQKSILKCIRPVHGLKASSTDICLYVNIIKKKKNQQKKHKITKNHKKGGRGRSSNLQNPISWGFEYCLPKLFNVNFACFQIPNPWGWV